LTVRDGSSLKQSAVAAADDAAATLVTK